MSPREKKLLIFFALAGFLIVNILGFKLFAATKAGIIKRHDKAVQELIVAENIADLTDEELPQMDWLDAHEPKPSFFETVQTSLQETAYKEATNTGLEVKKQDILPTDQSPAYYHRVKVKFTVNGTEQAFYNWCARINDPTKLRAVTSIVLSPNKEDDSKIDCIAVAEQWFIPASADPSTSTPPPSP
ncbi:MAG: hypothetical protein K9N23_09365 [Akkermansiaceae bacterium]|nr:hypothetical protein [Akkermansiaceae bacterium]